MRTENLTVYAQRPALLFQFILAEFLATYPEVQLVEKLYGTMEPSLADGSMKDIADDQLSRLLSAIATLMGSALEEEQPLPWTASKGCLGRLKHYCHVYRAPEEEAEHLATDLKLVVADAFHSLLQAREMLVQLRSATTIHTHRGDVRQVTQLLSRLSYNLVQMSELVLSLLGCYQRDENVLYFLLRHHEQFQRVYSSHIVHDLLDNSFEGGIEEAETYLKECYTTRGFEHVLTQISEQINRLRK